MKTDGEVTYFRLTTVSGTVGNGNIVQRAPL